jgi:Xaa-Pro aminopeptidase
LTAKLEAVRIAHASAEEGMWRAFRLLAECRIDEDALLVLDGEPLTSERVRLAIRECSEAPVAWDGITVTHGLQSADPESLGDGPIRAGMPIVIDLYPAGPGGFRADLARTVVVGSPPPALTRHHALCVDVLRSLEELLEPGVPARRLWEGARDAFAAAGARLGPDGASPADAWCWPVLGHGVGRSPHEAPTIDGGADVLAVGDVIALEPALYRHDLGGCRVENLYAVTRNGHERLTTLPLMLEVAAVLRAA